jgi:hypothetical protein
MELKKIQQHWNEFPEMSMEERPVLSTELEEVIVKDPLSGDFYLKNKLILKITVGSLLWLISVYQLWATFSEGRGDLYQQGILFLLLTLFVCFHLRLLLFADYPTLLSLPLMSFLGKIETTLEKYIQSFRIISAIMGFYLLAGIERILALISHDAYVSIQQNGLYRWLIIIFLSVTFYILLLHVVISKYRKLLSVVSEYKKEIEMQAQKI